MPRKKLILLDGSSLIYRAFFALPPLTTADGTPTNAVYGFTAMLLKLLEEERPDVILLALEGGPTFRHAEFTSYKAQRPRTPDDLAVQAPLARAAAEAFRLPIVQHPGFEADDVIGTLARRGEEAGFDVLIVTGDLDALQLVNDHVRVLVNRRGISEAQLFDRAAVEERFGLPPEALPDFKALKGDSSDNIPGIAGIGDKTAAQLLQQYGSLEALLDHAEELKPGRVRTNLLENRENALLYKRLATIVTDLPIEVHWDQWAYRGPDYPKARELFKKLEFRTLANRLAEFVRAGGGATPDEEPTAQVRWRKLEPGPELDAFLQAAAERDRLVVHTRQVGGEGRRGNLRAVAVGSEGETVVWEGARSGAAGGEGLFAGEGQCPVPAPLAAALRNPKVRLAGHDVKRSVHALGAGAEVQAETGFDTQIAAYVLNPGRASYRLEELAREFLSEEISTRDETELLARECDAIGRLCEPMTARLREEELEKVLVELELPLVRILARVEAVGVRVDRKELAALSERLAARIADLERQAQEVAGGPVNLGSPKQLQEVLFVRLALPTGRKTKTGYSTDSDVLQDIAAQTGHPLPALILEWRELSKLKNTYADALQALIDPADGRVHTTLNQTVAATGRLSSSDPNLQNIPIRTEVGREIRAAFVPEPGMRLLSADYSQIELRIMAHISRDEALVRAFMEDQDVHVATASRIFNVPPEEVTRDQRRDAKTVNFAVLYGQKEFGLSRTLRIPVREARVLIEAYFARFPGVLRYVEETLKQVRRDGYVETLPPYRRKRYIPGIRAGNFTERSAAEREALNAPVQGTAADIIKAAMIRVDEAMREAAVQSRMILQVHDELLFEILPEEEEDMKTLVRREMEEAYPLSVPLKVEVKVGMNWRDAEPE